MDTFTEFLNQLLPQLLPWTLELIGFFLKIAIFVVGLLIVIGFLMCERISNKILVKDLN